MLINSKEESSHEYEQNEDDIYQSVDKEEYDDVSYTKNTYSNMSYRDGNLFNKNKQPQENTNVKSVFKLRASSFLREYSFDYCFCNLILFLGAT